MDASIWVMFISKNSNTLEVEHSLLHSSIIIPAMDSISCQLTWTDLADKPHS